ncbi:hypothetical protein CDOO_13330 (plasmid) [Corynebacterium doosanense CAU 212 = DSM 45436]|uniref:Abi-like protein n=1 Tax=Corynebacterium doosanense CAU 212 = DSM 45436 TaxID=558173 RepID=A0A097IJN7_9CORY|nr:hypothetical protein CDOO_13330 [Corynebacterium doosanense CAU 212 = DSM 45436]
MDNRQIIIDHLGAARIEPYLRSAKDNRKKSLALYNWSATMASAIHTDLGITEVLLRNAMDQKLQDWNDEQSHVHAGDSWLLYPPARPLQGLVHNFRTTAVDRAEKDADNRSPSHPRHGQGICHDDALANTTFGLWKHVLPNHKWDANPSNQDNQNRMRIWDEGLKKAFPYIDDPTGRDTYKRVSRLYGLRNRVSHMDSILGQDIGSLAEDAFALVGAIHPSLQEWLTSTSTVGQILKQRPEI